MCTYHEVSKAVEPKIIALRAAEVELKQAEAEKAASEAELAVVQATLDAMQKRLRAATAQKAGLEAEASACRKKMENAATLIGALGDEESRWIEQSATLRASESRLIGDCAISSLFLSYLGQFNRVYRDQLLSEILTTCQQLSLPFSSDLDISSFLVEDTETGQWAAQGLPTDPLSIQNGVLVSRASRWPLLVDPQGQGRAWLARRESASGLRITQQTDPRFRNALEQCLVSGTPLLIENIEEWLDPVLDPVLEKNFIRRGKSATVVLGDKEVEVGDGFKLALTCRVPRPHFTPEIFARVTVIDFTVTPSGLEDQLLGTLVLCEKRELEEQRLRLVEEVATYRMKVAQLESDLLTRLSSSSGNLLDDTELVSVLAMTKATSTEVSGKMAIATDTRRHIIAACEEYRPAAHRAMLLYFIVADLAGINCMYQTSLAQFTRLYEASILNSEPHSDAAVRVNNIITHFTHSLYQFTQRGLYERHKLLFAFLIAYKVGMSSGALSAPEINAFLKLGNVGSADTTGSGSSTVATIAASLPKKKPKDWMPAQVWRNIVFLADRLPQPFATLPEDITKGDSAWAAWYDSESPEGTVNNNSTIKFANNLSSLTPFQRLCLVRAFREDRTLVAMSQFVSSTLGPSFVEPPPNNVEKLWAESGPGCPVVCLLSPGADPTKSIEDLAKRKKIKCSGISMGQGQEVAARKFVASAAEAGHWVLLQNAHLGLGYLAELEQNLSKLESPHPEFRLWITSEPHPSVPIGLLHASIKVTNEAPVGVRAGLRASYQWLSQDMIDAVSRLEWRKLLYALCFLHSVVQERRKFGPIGWNVPYEFNASDLSASIQALQNHVADMAARKLPTPDWPSLRYMISTIQYGGRITDDRDRELMDSFAEMFFHEDILQKGFSLLRDNPRYAVPDGSEIEVYRQAVEQLPPQDSPELFGLHPNADLTFRVLQVADAIVVIENTLPKDSSVAAPTPATTITTSASAGSSAGVVEKTIEMISSKLPAVCNAETMKESLKKLGGGPTAPLNIHLRQEIERLNKVIVTVSDTLKLVKLAIAGSIATSDDIAALIDALFSGRPPASWIKSSWESPNIGTWFQGLLSRHESLHSWLMNGRPKSFWLPGFFNPQGFLTAVKQEVTRRHAGDGWALDDVVMVSEVTKYGDVNAVREAPNEGVLVHGLFLEGCQWSAKEGKLVDSEPKTLLSPLHVLYITAVQGKDKRKLGFFEAPCYRVRRRTGANYIASFMLKTDQEKRKWVLRGAAILCSVD